MRIEKIAAFLFVAACLICGDAFAQTRPVTKTLQSAQTGNANGQTISVDGFSTIGIQVTVTGSATVNFEGTQDLSTWVAVVCTDTSDTSFTPITTTTTTKNVRCTVAGLTQFRTRTSGNTGSVTTTATASPGVLGKSGGGGGGGGGSGDITDVWGCASGNCNALTGAAGDSLDAGSADSSKPATRSTSLPGTCNEGQMHQDTDSGGTETYICTAANTWTKLAVDGSAGSSVGPASVTVNAGNSPYTVLSTDYLILCDTTSAARVVNLHAATTNHIIAVSNLGANTCTINRNGADTIVGDTVVILAAQHDGITLIADGSSRWTLH